MHSSVPFANDCFVLQKIIKRLSKEVNHKYVRSVQKLWSLATQEILKRAFIVLSSIPAVRKLLVIIFPFAFLFLVSGEGGGEEGGAVSGEMDFTMPCVCSVLDHRWQCRSENIINHWHPRMRLKCNFLVLATFWRYLRTATEQTQSEYGWSCIYMSFICLQFST